MPLDFAMYSFYLTIYGETRSAFIRVDRTVCPEQHAALVRALKQNGAVVERPQGVSVCPAPGACPQHCSGGQAALPGPALVGSILRTRCWHGPGPGSVPVQGQHWWVEMLNRANAAIRAALFSCLWLHPAQRPGSNNAALK